MAVRIAVYDRWGAFVRDLPVLSALFKDELNGEDSLTVSTQAELQKGWRLVWQDDAGAWHEHVVDNPIKTHSAVGVPVTAAKCLNSLCDTYLERVDDKRPSGTAAQILAAFLETSAWEVGTCDVEGSFSASAYHTTVRAAIQEAQKAVGGELETVIEVGEAGVTHRRVGLRRARGDQNSAKRFEWAKDLASVEREVGSRDPVSKLWVWGKGEQTDSGAYTRRIGIASVNGGRGYLEDAEATEAWGHPDGKGGKAPAESDVIFSDVEDPRELLEKGREYFETAKVPDVTYSLEAVDMASMGRPWERCGVGDRVSVIDRGFDEAGLRLQARITDMETDLISGATKVTIGTVVQSLADIINSQNSSISDLNTKAEGWESMADASPAWLETVVANLNKMSATYGGFHWASFKEGDVWSSVPLDEDGRPTETPAMAVRLGPNGLELSDATGDGGALVWRPLGDGSGISASEVRRGALEGGRNRWDIEGGDLTIGQGSLESPDGALRVDVDAGTVRSVDGSDALQLAAAGIDFHREGSLAGHIGLTSNGCLVQSGGDLVLGAPGALVVSTDDPGSAIVGSTAMREATLTRVTDVALEGGTLRVSRSRATYRQGILVADEAI